MSLAAAVAGPLARFLTPHGARRLGRLLGGEAGARRLEAIAAAGLDPVRFCRHLTLEGWERLEAAAGRGRGVVVVFPPIGRVGIAPWPLGIYGGPLYVWGEGLADLLPRRARERFRLEPVAGAEEARRSLAAGGRLGVLWGSGAERRRAVELAATVGAPLLPVVCLPEPRGGWRIAVGSAVSPRDDEPLPALEERVEQEIRGGAAP